MRNLPLPFQYPTALRRASFVRRFAFSSRAIWPCEITIILSAMPRSSSISELTNMIAPPFCFMEKNDAIFPYDSVKKLSDSVISEYESLGVPENFCSIMEDCAHDFRLKEQENALSFFSKHL